MENTLVLGQAAKEKFEELDSLNPNFWDFMGHKGFYGYWQEGNEWRAFDNRTGDNWDETFDTESEAQDWLKDEEKLTRAQLSDDPKYYPIDKFSPEFVEKYKHNALFNTILQGMGHNVTPYSFIETLLEMVESKDKTIQDLTENGRVVYIAATPEHIEQIKKQADGKKSDGQSEA